MQLKQCICGAKVLCIITDLSTRARICHVCSPEQNSDIVRVARKMDAVFAATGNLNGYSLSERLRNLKGNWT
jgi:hypothetical protein